MTPTVIKVENISKYYRLGLIGGGTLREDMGRWIAKLRGKPDPLLIHNDKNYGNRKSGQIWALDNINIEVKQGEILGIIGRNGAGKSTLLKILSRITAPTEGIIKINGRVASLLEVGTGFHKELTGRENIYLNGAILGMSRKEVTKKLDEIIEFAEMAKFIDTPVKRYSSGMTVRLAFAVAAHLEPEILIIDEVLAVGDATFQKKCLGKMKDVAGHGRTVLFVSHNMGMITSLCTRVVLLDKGNVASEGATSEVVASYFTHGNSTPYLANYDQGNIKIGDHLATLLSAQVTDEEGIPAGESDIRKPVKIQMRYELLQKVSVPPYANFHFFDDSGTCAFVSAGRGFVDCDGTEPGVYTAECLIPGNLLNNLTYFVGLALTFTHNGLHVSFNEKDALCITIIDPVEETINDLRCGYAGSIPGVVRPELTWRTRMGI
jgi:lipopolysaccharide transport system ATP-binding protein